MLDFPIIQGRGFRNVVEDGRVTGFQFQLRNPNYRGGPASMLDGIEVVVDGERIPDHVPLWTLQGRTFTRRRVAGIHRRPLAAGRAGHHHRAQAGRPVGRRAPDRGHALPAPVVLPAADRPVAVPLRRLGRHRARRCRRAAQYCVSTYSYTGDVNTTMTLEDVFADIADLGATGIEILGEGNLPNYPTPDAAWIDSWHGLVEKYGLTPTNFGSWVDTTRFYGRDLTAEEGAEQLQLDLRLAKELGFTSVRPKFGVVSWDLDPHPIWEEVVERSLDLAAELDVVICPEIHSPTPIQHPVTQGYVDFIEKTGTEHFKLLIDTGIFQTAAVLRERRGISAPTTRTRSRRRCGRSRVPDGRPRRGAAAHPLHPGQVLRDRRRPARPARAVGATSCRPLEKAGWNGWLSSEYEGRREPYRGRDQVRRQHALLRSLQSRGVAGADPSRRRRPVPAAGRADLDARGLRHPRRAGADPRVRVLGAARSARRTWPRREETVPGPHGPVPVRIYEPAGGGDEPALPRLGARRRLPRRRPRHARGRLDRPRGVRPRRRRRRQRRLPARGGRRLLSGAARRHRRGDRAGSATTPRRSGVDAGRHRGRRCERRRQPDRGRRPEAARPGRLAAVGAGVRLRGRPPGGAAAVAGAGGRADRAPAAARAAAREAGRLPDRQLPRRTASAPPTGTPCRRSPCSRGSARPW